MLSVWLWSGTPVWWFNLFKGKLKWNGQSLVKGKTKGSYKRLACRGEETQSGEELCWDPGSFRSTGISPCDHQGGAECHETGLNPIRAEKTSLTNGDPHIKAKVFKKKKKKPCKFACHKPSKRSGRGRLKLASFGRSRARSESRVKINQRIQCWHLITRGDEFSQEGQLLRAWTTGCV